MKVSSPPNSAHIFGPSRSVLRDVFDWKRPAPFLFFILVGLSYPVFFSLLGDVPDGFRVVMPILGASVATLGFVVASLRSLLAPAIALVVAGLLLILPIETAYGMPVKQAWLIVMGAAIFGVVEFLLMWRRNPK